MTSSDKAAGSTEWSRHWPLVVAAALGYSISALHSYGIGSFIIPLHNAFGWSRAFASLVLTIVGLSDALMSVPMGILIDRIGPRRLALIGTLLMAPAFAALGTATGSASNWFVLSILIGIAHSLMLAPVWTSAVATRFRRSRGLAFGMTLSGGSLSAAVFPILATWLIGRYGWRWAFAQLAGLWLCLVWPVLALFFRGAADENGKAPVPACSSDLAVDGVSVRDGLRSADFYKLVVASGLFAFLIIGIIVHLIAILIGRGATPIAAAATASLVGIFSIIGRLGTGLLLDRLPAHIVGACVLLLPVVGCGLLILYGKEALVQSAAASSFGLTLGAEVDVVAYLAARRFGLRHFGVFNGAMTGALAIGVACGPLAAGAIFDHFGSYDQFLMLSILFASVSSVALVSVRQRAIAN